MPQTEEEFLVQEEQADEDSSSQFSINLSELELVEANSYPKASQVSKQEESPVQGRIIIRRSLFTHSQKRLGTATKYLHS